MNQNKNVFLNLILTIFIIFISSCSTTENSKIKELEIKTEFRHNKNNNSWIIKYSFSQPVTGAIFKYNLLNPRKFNWKCLSESCQISNSNNTDMISSIKSEGQKIFELELKTYYEEQNKDYNLFYIFSDSSVLVFTKYFKINSINFVNKLNSNYIIKNKLVFYPDKEYIFINELSFSNKKIELLDDKEQYVYFGKNNFLKTGNLTFILDTRLPNWIKEKVKFYIPKFKDYFEKSLSYEIDKPLTIFFGFSQIKDEILDFSGNSMSRMIQLQVSGKLWEKETKKNINKLLGFIAHELIHQWNSELFNYEENLSSIWMHEGGAEIISLNTLKYFKLIDENEYFDIIKLNLNLCNEGLKDTNLSESYKFKNFKNYYTCGLIIGDITNRLINQIHPNSSGIIYFWKKLFDLVEANKGPYTQKMYFDTLKLLSVSETNIKKLKKLIFSNKKENWLYFYSEINNLQQ